MDSAKPKLPRTKPADGASALQVESAPPKARKTSTSTCALVRAPIDVANLEKMVSTDACGAVTTFVGQVRNHSRGKQVKWLEYEAYEPMALKQMEAIMRDAQAKWPVRVGIRHRLGRMAVGDAAVVICVAAPHRAETFDACRYCIDVLKETVPIWKKEICPNGAFWIEGEDAIKAEPAVQSATKGRAKQGVGSKAP